MNLQFRIILVGLMAILVSSPAQSTVTLTPYTDEAAYLAALSTAGYAVVREGFEDDAAWGGARAYQTAPAVTSQGVTWLPNTSFGGLVATPDHSVGYGPWFYGVIDTSGFTSFEVSETEAVDEMILLFADNMTLARAAPTAVAAPRTIARMKPCMPNPCNPRTTIAFTLEQNANIILEIIDLRGRRVRTILDDVARSPGGYAEVWNGGNDFGEPVASGTYFARLRTGSRSNLQPVVVVR